MFALIWVWQGGGGVAFNLETIQVSPRPLQS